MTPVQFTRKRNLCHQKLNSITASLDALLTTECLSPGEKAQLCAIKNRFDFISKNFQTLSSRGLAKSLFIDERSE